MALVNDEKQAIANFAAAADELIRTWGWQNPRSEPMKSGEHYHFINRKGVLMSGFLYGQDPHGGFAVGNINKSGALDRVVPVLYKPMKASEVAL